MPVQMFKPKSLTKAYSLARLQEITMVALKNKPKPTTRSPVHIQPSSSYNQHQFTSHTTTHTNHPAPKYSNQVGLLPLLTNPKLANILPQNTKTITS